MTIIVTREFTTAVRQFIPIEAGEEYDPVHEYGTAMAKTIPLVRDHQLRFVIIFDSRIIANRTRLDRNTLVLHELVHVKNYLLKFESVGEEEFVHPRGDKLGMLLHNSQVIWEEYALAKRTLRLYAN